MSKIEMRSYLGGNEVYRIVRAEDVSLIDFYNKTLDKELQYIESEASNHYNNITNPHNVTKAQIGLSNADNTADINKKVFSATQLATPRKIGNASFDGTKDISLSEIDAISTSIFKSHTDNKSNPHTVTKSQIGLGNVDNTADSSKKVLSATKLTTARTINGVSFDGTADINILANPAYVQLTNQDLNTVLTFGNYFAAGSNAVTNKPSDIDAFHLEVKRTASGYKTQILTAGNGQVGKIYQRQTTDSGKSWNPWTYIYSQLYKPSKSDVGLGNVDNTADSTKNVASAKKSPLLSNLFQTRPTDANISISANGSGGISTFKATNSMTANKPSADGHIIHMFWDNTGGFDSQISVPTRSSDSGYSIQYRGQGNGLWGAWKTLLDSSNYTTYTVNKTGLGASGTWGINITGSAAKLTTARSINGTNFDGSAAITTAKWGTARTISLSGAITGSVNIDGSGNATLATSEGNVSFKRMGEINKTIDWNTLKDPGCYKIQMAEWGDATKVHSPNEYGVLYSFGLLLVFKSAVVSEDRIIQIYLPHSMSNSIIVLRMHNGTSWNSWTPIFKGISKSYIGLGNVDNTADSAKNVLSATKLTTARTINGTSFNGTANITTVNWGTARTVTIGNTGKSVNGAGNVAWSLAEIGALPLTGGIVTGKTYLREGYNVIAHNTSAGSAGYIMVAQLKINHTYVNSPVEFKIINRGAMSPMYVSILFSNANITDPGLNKFTFRGHDRGAYLVKSATSTWDLYIRKSENYDSIAITDIDRHMSYLNDGIIISYPGTFVSTLPEGHITAVRFEQASVAAVATALETPRKIGNATFDGTKDLSLAEIGAASIDADAIVKAIQSKMVNLFYPIGSIKMSFENVNPGTYLTGTTWELTSKGAYIRGVDPGNASLNVVKTGGSNTIDLSHAHTIAAHTHTIDHAHSIAGHSHTVNNHAHSTSGHVLTTGQMPSHNHLLYLYNSLAYGVLTTQTMSIKSNVQNINGMTNTQNSGLNEAHAHGDTGGSAPNTNSVALNTNSGGGNSGGTALTTSNWNPTRAIEPVYQTLFVWKRTK